MAYSWRFTQATSKDIDSHLGSLHKEMQQCSREQHYYKHHSRIWYTKCSHSQSKKICTLLYFLKNYKDSKGKEIELAARRECTHIYCLTFHLHCLLLCKYDAPATHCISACFKMTVYRASFRKNTYRNTVKLSKMAQTLLAMLSPCSALPLVTLGCILRQRTFSKGP